MQFSTVYCDVCGAANRPQARFCIACGQAMPVASSLPPAALATPVVSSTTPTILRGSTPSTPALTGLLPAHSLLKQRYLILSQLGQGGMGAVYQAADTQLGDRLVAVKEMSQKGLDPQEIAEAAAAFKREAYMLAGLPHHSHLPSMYDHFEDGGRWYLVMDFIAGETLETYVNKAGGKLLLEEVLDIGLQLATVLAFLHSRQPPVIFRDLKPANVMRTPEGNLFLIDFGIARHFKAGQAKDTIAYGSAGYAAPEQYGKAQTTPQSDIYSLGAILHHLLTSADPSHTPFVFAPLSSATVPAALATLIAQMVETKMDQRPTSMVAIKQDFQRIAAQPSGNLLPPTQSVGKPSLPPTQLAVPAPSRSSSPSLGTVLYTYRGHSACVVAVAWSPDSKRIASGGTSGTDVWDAVTGRQEFSVYAGYYNAWSPDGICIAAGLTKLVVCNAKTGREILSIPEHVEALAWSPDSSYLVHSDQFYKEAIFVRDAATGKERLTYRGHKTRWAYALAWSPDGKSIASGSHDETVQVWDAVTGHTRLTYRGHSSYVKGVAWSPDGKSIASAAWDRTVQVWDAATGCLFLTYRGHSEQVNTLAWSPDGKSIASGSSDKTVQVWDAATGRTRLTYRGHSEQVNTLAWSPDGTRIASGQDKIVQVWQAS